MRYLKKTWYKLWAFLKSSPVAFSMIILGIVWFVDAAVVFYFENGVQGSNITSYQDAIWWGIVTFLTIGYGDRFPVTPEGRLAAGFIMVTGVVGIGIITAKISSFFIEKALRERRGFVDSTLLKGHYIVCGWKDEMISLLQYIMQSNPNLHSDQLVLINNMSDDEIEAIHASPNLKQTKVIKGDFFSENNLRRAAPDRAKKVMILSDYTPNANGQRPTMVEADARCIMAAMTLGNIAKGTPVVAEILDASLDHYLRLAGVNEIIYSREYSRLLLATASTGTGVANIFYDLLDPRSPHFLSTRPIPEKMVGKAFIDLKAYVRENYTGCNLVGVLENSGNSHIAKEAAIKRAQQTPNVKQLVQNLTAVKSIKFNNPVFSPPDGYVVSDGSMAIVIENRSSEKMAPEAHHATT